MRALANEVKRTCLTVLGVGMRSWHVSDVDQIQKRMSPPFGERAKCVFFRRVASPLVSYEHPNSDSARFRFVCECALVFEGALFRHYVGHPQV